jgi:hypothetical protein
MALSLKLVSQCKTADPRFLAAFDQIEKKLGRKTPVAAERDLVADTELCASSF